MATISLEDWEVEELGAVASNSKKLSDIVSRSASFGPKVGVDLARGICERVSLDLDETFSVIRGLARICFLRSRLNITSTAAVEVLTGSLEQGNKTKILTAWNGAKAEIVKALEQINEEHAIVVSIKADFVARSRPNILASARLFTESRPVFNEGGDKVLFNVISHMLSLDYHGEDGRRKEVNLSLDAMDVAQLTAALMDADTETTAFKKSISIPSARPFESFDDENE